MGQRLPVASQVRLLKKIDLKEICSHPTPVTVGVYEENNKKI
jgi:hypothetical protein